MKIAFFSTKKYDMVSFNQVNENFGFEIDYFEETLNERNVLLTKGYEAICVFVNDKINAHVIASLKEYGVKTVALRCAGFNNVDVEAAKKTGLHVVRVPAYSPAAVAEHAVALILTLNRKIHKAYIRVRENNFSIENLTGFTVQGKTVGVIGTGLIGEAFAHIMSGFGCNIYAYDVYPKENLKAKGVIYDSLENVLKVSDIVSLHCPLLPETHHIINKNTLAIMKKGAMLINTSRGALLDTVAVIDSLRNKHLGYLGIDVYEQEEGLFFNDLSEHIIEDDVLARLMTFPNVIITGHQGFFTWEALRQIAKVTFESLQAVKQNRPVDTRCVVA